MLVTALMLAAPMALAAAEVGLQILPCWHGRAVALDALVQTNAGQQVFSVTRLDFLLSDLALRRADGTWLETTNWQSWFNGKENVLRAASAKFPAGEYNRMRFNIGLPAELNHSDSTQFPANNPLNPNLNGLHWGWAGGYVFLALEGLWRSNKTNWQGYSYHLANDPSLMTVELPLTARISAGSTIYLTLNLDGILPGKFSSEDTTTHSREGDALAPKLCRCVEKAITVERVRDLDQIPDRPVAAKVSSVQTHPYRFTYSVRFPPPELPLDNPLTEEGMKLGRRLFFDKNLSVNGRESCATCHQPEHAFAQTGMRVSLGAEGKPGSRNAMSLYNLAWRHSFFWDGRAATLRQQALQPIENPVELHLPMAQLAQRLMSDPTYIALFMAAFGGSEINSNRIGLALEQFVLTLVSGNSKFDQVLQGAAALTPAEQEGFSLFMTEYDPRRGMHGADCFHCHGGPLFQSQRFANNGLDAVSIDAGRAGFTKRAGDQGRFMVPSLRNVAVTAPYMHDGRFKTLEEVVAHYCTGVKRSTTLDPNLAKHPDGGVPLSLAQQKALVAFLKTLTELPAAEQSLSNN